MLSRCYMALYVSLIIYYTSTVNLPGVILLFKIRDASGERKYLITASNLTELTLTLNKSSKNVLLKCSFIRLIYSIIVLFRFFPWGGAFLTRLIDLRFRPWGIWSKNFKICQIPASCPYSPEHSIWNFSTVRIHDSYKNFGTPRRMFLRALYKLDCPGMYPVRKVLLYCIRLCRELVRTGHNH